MLMKKTFTALLFFLLVQTAFGQKEPAPTKGEPIPVDNTDVHVLTLPNGLRPGDGIPGKPVTANALSASELMVFMEEDINSSNNTAATATPLGSTSVKVRGNIYPNADVDFYSFNAVAGDRVYAATMTSGSSSGSTDSQLRLIGSDGTTVIEFDEDDGTLGGLASSIAGAVIPTTGTYYLQVNHFSATTTLRGYDLYLKVQSGSPTPEVESNDGAGTANDTPASGWISGSRNPATATEQDWFSISLTAGETVFLSLDLDPERDGTTWNGRLGLAQFGDGANQILVVDDASVGSAANPLSEAFFFTVKETGTYYLFVDSATPTTGGPTATYNLSVSKLAAPTGYTTYTSTDVPQPIGPGAGSVNSTITIPDTKRIKDLAVRITLNHAKMMDIDAILTTPEGNQIALFTDIGASATGGQTQMDLRLSDYNAIPPTFTVLKPVGLQPELQSKLDQLKGMKTNGTWTLTLYDDVGDASGGTLTSWALEVLEDATPATLATATTIYSEDFESGDGGFTHSGAADSWARGTPNTPATTTTNPVAAFTTANSGVNCWKTNLTGTYAVSSDQTLESGDINLTGVTANVVTLSWAMKYQLESATFDRLEITVEEVGGSGLSQPVFYWLGATQTAAVSSPVVNVPMSSGWGLYFADISAFKGKIIRFKVRLITDTSINFAGVAIDDVKIYADCTAPTATLSASPSTTLTCAQSSLTLTAGGGSTYAFSGPGVVSQSGNTAVINAAGVYSVTVTSTSGCSSTTSIAISQNNTTPTPTISASPSATLSCAQSSLTLTAGGGNTYAFSGPGVVSQSGNTAVVNAAGVYSVTVTNTTNGCFSTTTTTVTSNTAVPTVSIAPASGTLTCASASLTLTATSSATALRWSDNSSATTLVVSASGVYSVTATGVNGCTAVSNSVTVSENKTPPTNVSLTSGTLTCAQTSVTLTASSTGGTSYTLSNGQPGSSTTNMTGQFVVSTPGTYTVTVSGANGCTATATSTVTSNTAAPVASLSASPSTTCAPTAITLTAGGGTSYTFSAGATQIGTSNQAIVTQSGTYSVTVSNASGCTATASTSVTVNTPPAAPTLTGVSRTVDQSNTPLPLGQFVNAENGNTLSFSGVNGMIASPPKANVSQVGVQSFSVSQTSANGCVSGVTVFTITVQATTPASQTVCRSSGVVLTTITAGVRYEWYKNGQSAPFKLTEIASIQRGTATSSLTLVSVQTTASYYVKVFQANGSFSFEGPFTVTVNYGCIAPGARVAAELATEVPLSITLMPNPIESGQLRAVVRGASGQSLSVQLLDLRGQVILEQRWAETDAERVVEWNVGSQSAGVYLLKAQTPDRHTVVKVLK